MNSEPLKSFLETGEKPRSRKQISALLDQSRNQLLSQPTNQMQKYFHKGKAYENLIDIPASELQGGSMLAQLAAAHRAAQDDMPTAITRTAPPRRNPAARRPAPTPVIHRATAAAPKPSAAAPSARSATPAPTADKDGFEVFPRSPKYRMSRAEFRELSASDRQRFLAAKGTLTA